MDYYNVKDYGALGNGSHDDGPGINAAIAAASADPLGKAVVYFPYGNYVTSQTITLYSTVSVFTFGGSSIAATGNVTDCFVFSAGGPGPTPGNYAQSMYRLPNVFNFPNGAGIKFPPGSVLADVFVENISGCLQGVLIQGTSGVAGGGQSISFNTINANTYGIMLQSLNGTGDIQGCFIRGNFLNGNRYSIFFTGPAGTSQALNVNHFIIPSIEGGGGSPANSQGITFDSAIFSGGNVFDFQGFFGGFTNGYIVKQNGAQVTQQIFRLGIYDNTGSYDSFAGINSGGFNTGAINSILIQNTAGAISVNGSVAANTSSNTRSSFNGGVPITATSFMVSFTFPSMVQGQNADFYVYSPFCTGASAQPKFFGSQFGGGNLVCVACEDESVTDGDDGNGGIPNQIHIRLKALGPVSAGTLWGRLDVGS